MRARQLFVPALFVFAAGVIASAVAEEPEKKPTLWTGALHLGDDPARYSDNASAGMAMQVPFKPDPAKTGKLTVVAQDVQTLLGDGHYVELVAHFAPERPGTEPAREVVVESFRLKDAGGEADAEYLFQFDPRRGLSGVDPDYYSIRIRVDTSIGFSLWDDFLLKRIEVQQ
jgi:hypothetical protein